MFAKLYNCKQTQILITKIDNDEKQGIKISIELDGAMADVIISEKQEIPSEKLDEIFNKFTKKKAIKFANEAFKMVLDEEITG